MKVVYIKSLVFGLCLFCLCCLVTPIVLGQQASVKEKQVDVITIKRHPARIGPVSMTVDVREVVRDLYNDTLYNKATDILSLAGNAYLSSDIVNLLRTTIDETYSETYDEELIELRLRATSLLGLSRNSEAVPIITNLLHNDPVWRVRNLAARRLGGLVGETAIPDLLHARVGNWKHRDRGTYCGSCGNGVLDGLGAAGGEAVPILIRMLKTGIEAPCGIIEALERTGDRRAISPLIEIMSHAESNRESLSFTAAEALARHVMLYGFTLKYRGKTFMEGVPATPRVDRIVTESDRNRIRQALELAGYDIYELTNTFPGFEPITDPEFEITVLGKAAYE